MHSHQVVQIQCTDQKGLIAKISGILFQNDHNVLIMKEFVEESSNRFFARIELSGALNVSKVQNELAAILPSDATILVRPKQKKRLIILVTKEHHCLSDLLIRHYFGELNATIESVIGTYPNLADLCQRMNIPFYFIEAGSRSKESFEAELLARIAGHHPDYIVLAKFMRILSPSFVAHFTHRILNIHHSFLPAFVGAHPYKQAFLRGVKIIGATAHFVNENLDEGPIITQKTIEIDHEYELQDMIEAGHEIERAVLAEALKKVLDDHVFVSGNKTIILD
jgi:formyltetrahydrofolate deformylase